MADSSRYGSDKSGLVWAYHFHQDKPATLVASEDILTLLQQINSSENQFLWLHFSLANASTEHWLQRNLSLPDSFYELLTDQAGSTRLEQDGNSLVSVINDVMYEFNPDSTEISSGRLYIDNKLMISVRMSPLRSLEQLRSEVRDGEVFRSTISLLAHLLQEQVGVLMTILRNKSVRIDSIEDKFLENRISFQRGELGTIRRILVRLQRLLAPEPAAFFRLLNRPPSWVKDTDLVELRQAAEEFSLAVGDAANLIERVKLLQEELAALLNEQSNRTLHILTLVTVLALPINLTAGLFGMNVGGIPWSANSHGFFLVAGGIGLLTLLVAAFVLNRPKE